MKNSLLILLLVSCCAVAMEPGKKRKRVELDKKNSAMHHEEKSEEQAQPAQVLTVLDKLLPSNLAEIVYGYCSLPESCKIITQQEGFDGCQLSACGQSLMMFGLENASVYEVTTGREIKTIAYPMTMWEKHQHPDGSQLLLNDINEKLMIQDLSTQICSKFSTAYKALSNAKFSTTGKYVGAAYQDSCGYHVPRYFGIFDAASGALVASKRIEHRTRPDFVFNADDSRVAFGEDGRYLVLLHSSDLQEERSIPVDRNYAYRTKPFCFSPDNRYLLSGDADSGSEGLSGDNHRVSRWEVKSGTLVRTYAHPQSVVAVQCAPHNAWFATGCADGKMRFIEPSTGETLFEYSGIDGFKRVIHSLNRIEISKDGQVVVACKDQHSALVFITPMEYLQRIAVAEEGNE